MNCNISITQYVIVFFIDYKIHANINRENKSLLYKLMHIAYKKKNQIFVLHILNNKR